MLYRLILAQIIAELQGAVGADNVDIVFDVNLRPADGDNLAVDHIKNTSKET